MYLAFDRNFSDDCESNLDVFSQCPRCRQWVCLRFVPKPLLHCMGSLLASDYLHKVIQGPLSHHKSLDVLGSFWALEGDNLQFHICFWGVHAIKEDSSEIGVMYGLYFH